MKLLNVSIVLCNDIFAFPVAYFADRFRRDRILKLSSIIGFLSLACTVYVFTQLKPGVKNLTVLYSCFIGWGLYFLCWLFLV